MYINESKDLQFNIFVWSFDVECILLSDYSIKASSRSNSNWNSVFVIEFQCVIFNCWWAQYEWVKGKKLFLALLHRTEIVFGETVAYWNVPYIMYAGKRKFIWIYIANNVNPHGLWFSVYIITNSYTAISKMKWNNQKCWTAAKKIIRKTQDST